MILYEKSGVYEDNTDPIYWKLTWVWVKGGNLLLTVQEWDLATRTVVYYNVAGRRGGVEWLRGKVDPD